MGQEEKHIKNERRQKDLIMEFVHLGLHLRALLDQWGGLHSLSSMKRKSTRIGYKKESYTSILKNGRKIQNSYGEMNNSIVFVASRSAETI